MTLITPGISSSNSPHHGCFELVAGLQLTPLAVEKEVHAGEGFSTEVRRLGGGGRGLFDKLVGGLLDDGNLGLVDPSLRERPTSLRLVSLRRSDVNEIPMEALSVLLSLEVAEICVRKVEAVGRRALLLLGDVAIAKRLRLVAFEVADDRGLFAQFDLQVKDLRAEPFRLTQELVTLRVERLGVGCGEDRPFLSALGPLHAFTGHPYRSIARLQLLDPPLGRGHGDDQFRLPPSEFLMTSDVGFEG